MLQEFHRRALQRAAAILGGKEQLRAHLGVSEAQFAAWPGRRELPRDVFLRLVDIITEDEVRTFQNSRLRTSC